jgi:hypothetical protein
MENKTEKCANCEKNIADLEKFKEKRYCNGKDKDGKYRFALFCLDCEPYLKMGKRH